MLVFVLYAWAQDRTVSGKVTDAETGESLPGVNVLLKGTGQGVNTDLDGNYKISVPSEGGTLVYTFIGMEKVEESIGARSVIDVSMSSDVQQLSEVVVTASGLEANKAALGYSVQNVNADEIVESRETNIVNALNSKVAGVTVVSSAGTPGGSSNIRIRGSKSINGSNSPLFVVDGIPIDNREFGGGVDGVNRSNRAIDLNPSDIEKMTVLKGAAATVLYGIRAANGAIIITTKKGKKGAPRVNVSSTFRLDQVNKLPERQTKWAQGRSENGQLIYRGPETGEGNSWGPAISSLEFDGATDYPYDKNGRLVPQGEGNGMAAIAYDPYEALFVNGYTTDNTVSVSGGTDVAKYYVSAGQMYNAGVIPGSDFGRTSIKATITADLSDRLTLGASANYINSGGYRVQQGSNISGIMLGLLRNTPTFDIGNGLKGREAVDEVSVYEFPDGTQRSYRGGVYDNPFWTINNVPFEDDVNRIIGYTSLEYKLTDHLFLSYKLGLDTYSESIKNSFNINSAAAPAGSVNYVERNAKDINSDFLINYNNTFGDFAVSGTIGHNYYQTQTLSSQTFGTELNVAKFYHISNANTVQGFAGNTRRKLYGVFGTVNVGWQETVYLELSGRNDWSSILPNDANSFFYPAVSLGYVFTETLGLSEGSIFPYGKIRASYSQVGNDGGNAFIYATNSYFSGATWGGDGFITTGGLFPEFGGVNAFDRDGLLGNQALQPETTTTFEIGADLHFLNDRLNLDVTYYESLTTDAIIAVAVAPTTGFTSSVQNAAEISNKGIEAILTATPVLTDDFSWDVTLNFTQYENVVEKLAENVESISLAGFVSTTSRAIEGEPFGALFGNGYEYTDAGELVIDDAGWPVQDPDARILGDPNPDFVAGLTNTFNYKGLSLSALLDFRKGGDIWNGTYGILKTFGVAKVTEEGREIKGYVFDGVVNQGTAEAPQYVENTTPVDFYDPNKPIGQNAYNRYAFGGLPEDNIQDASWIRLRNVSLGYELPKSILGDGAFKRVKATLSARNLLLITGYNGIDPETNLTGASNGFGLDYFNNPNTKSYSVTLDLTF
jgi:TonB-linked SusC/RagA family outer membrane protein